MSVLTNLSKLTNLRSLILDFRWIFFKKKKISFCKVQIHYQIYPLLLN